MKKDMKVFKNSLIFLFLAVLFVLPANAALSLTGQVNATNGFPLWYQDANGLALELCSDPNNPLCLADPVIPGNAFSEQIGFGAEAFWWNAEAQIDGVGPNRNGRARLVLALEAAFASGDPAAGQQISFGRVRVRIDGLRKNTQYTVTHPFGTETFVSDEFGQIISARTREDDTGCLAVPCNFAEALASPIGPFLTWDPAVPPAAPAGYIGDPAVEHTITPGPNGAVFQIVGPDVGGNNVNVVETALFTVSGKITTPVIADPVLTTITVSPSTALLAIGDSQPFTAVGLDQFSRPMVPQPVVTWSVDPPAIGTIDGVTGLFTATDTGTTTTRATSGAVTGTASVTVEPFVRVGPIAPNGFPLWYKDTAGLALELCSDPANPLCLADPVVGGNAFSQQIGFGAEAFWWNAEALIKKVGTRGGRARLVLALEAAFLNGDPAPGDQMSFGRIRVRITGLERNAAYTITHPYGTETFISNEFGQIISARTREDDTGCVAAPCNFALALRSPVGERFLTWDPAVPPAAPAGFIGDPGVEHRVTGSPTGNNIFRIAGPNAGGRGIDVIETDLFSVSGKIAAP